MAADAIGAWIGFAVSIAGFVITIWQLQKTKSAAESARDAVIATEARVGRDLLLSVLPRLLEIEGQLTRTLNDGRLQDAGVMLLEWRNAAAEAEALLRRRNRENSTADALVTAIPAISDARILLSEALVHGENPSLETAFRVITIACSAVSAELARLKAYTEVDVRV